MHRVSHHEVLGWAYAYACSALDRGEDIRQIEVPTFVDACETDLKIGHTGQLPLPDPTNPDDVVTMFASATNAMSRLIGANSRAKGFWHEGQNREKGTMIALMHSELSEALEALREPVPDRDLEPLGPESEKCPGHLAVAEELADTVIRIMDFCDGFGIDLGRAVEAKVEYNVGRPVMHGGKAF